MPRAARLVVPEVPLHLVQRGANREPCYFRNADRERYLDYLFRYSLEFGCAVHAYCLMDNHVHLFLTPHEPAACARMMKQLNQCYVQHINRAMGRSGPLWDGRFHSCLVDSEAYTLLCYRYIELNPVRAGMVRHARDYPWSSHPANAGGQTNPIVTAHPVFLALGETPALRGGAYRALFDLPLEDAAVQAIRKATRGGYRLGTQPRPRGRPKIRYVPV